jgi:transposase/putative transposase
VKAKRKRHDSQFKERVALEALKGIKTVQQIAKDFDVHPVQVTEWKKRLSAHAGSVFENGKEREVEDFSAERSDRAPGAEALGQISPRTCVAQPVEQGVKHHVQSCWRSTA